ncbi:hypothetical protein DQ04_02661030 [Trypanosoma grayi]|uniref:hypothetical protein n=1 Tax=Trypanosoma grayi TaxID=71804 RepID=UPI0004F47533|nr:hypothetical protein DQ04_02661030 [Trypanosoma grayi]KEG11398.1 hypothetical protein DQ04_02661030 [Trypanosoma grayi]
MGVVDDVLQRTRLHVAQRRLRLDDFFMDFDSLRSGRITAAQFRRALAVNHIELNEEEFAALASAFAAPAVNHTASVSGPRADAADVSYLAFLQALRAEDPPAELLTTLGRKAKVLSAEEEHTLEAAIRSLRHAVRVRGLQMRKAFEDFDPFRSGKVTASRFRRCLPFETMREDVLQLIIKKYGNEDGDVLYAAWCRDLDDDTDSPKGATGSAGCSPFTSPRGRTEPLSVDELVRVLREQFAMYRLRCDDYLRDYDHFRTGFVTAPQFESALGRLRFVNFRLTADHIDTLARAYTDAAWESTDSGTNEEVFPRVNYVQFLADTNPRRDDTALGATNYYEETRNAGQFLGDASNEEYQRAEAVVNKVRQLVRSNRIQLIPTLHDFDRVRKGIYEHRTCTKSRFERSLATNKIFLKPEELALLVKQYVIRSADGSPGDEVNYYQFVMDVDQAHKPELKPARLFQSSAVAELQKEAEGMRPPPADTVPAVLAKVAAQAEERQLRVNEFFIDFDPLRSGIVQTEKFAVALGIAGLQLHPHELEILQTEYKSTKARDHIDTNRFCADVGEIAPTVVPSVTTKFNFTASRSMTGAAAAMLKDAVTTPADKFTETEREELRRLLARLRHDVAAHHALLAPFFTDFDRFHRGKILRSNFLQALARHRFVLTPAETRLLSRYYASPEDTELIEYLRFVRDVGHNEAAVASPREAPNSMRSDVGMTTMRVMDGGVCDELVDEGLVDQVLTRICCFLQERNARLAEFFPDGDELRHRHVTNTRFRHCVSILGLDLTEEELRALETAFAHPELQGHVDYPAFVSVVSEKLRAGVGIMAVTQRRRGLGPLTAGSAASTAGSAAAAMVPNSVSSGDDAACGAQSAVKSLEDAQTELYKSAIDTVRRTLASRRSVSLPAFRQYDRTRKGFVKEGQFFATLMSLGVQLSPAQSDALRKVHSIGGGGIGYTKFSLITDDQRFA